MRKEKGNSHQNRDRGGVVDRSERLLFSLSLHSREEFVLDRQGVYYDEGDGHNEDLRIAREEFIKHDPSKAYQNMNKLSGKLAREGQLFVQKSDAEYHGKKIAVADQIARQKIHLAPPFVSFNYLYIVPYIPRFFNKK